MGTKNRRKFSREFKLEALKLMSERGMTSAAESLGISTGMLCNWRKKLEKAGTPGLGAAGVARTPEDEVKELRIRVRELEEEKEILKKAAAYFAKHTR